jgi:hypothetical protein
MRGTHEQRFDGFVVGYVPRDWMPRAGAVELRTRRPLARLPERYRAPLRALGSRACDAELVISGVRVVGAACVCGWRSPLCVGLGPAHWERSAVHVSPRADDALAALWCDHARRASALERTACSTQNRARSAPNRARNTHR